MYDVVKSMRTHSDNTDLNESACVALLGLAMEGKGRHYHLFILYVTIIVHEGRPLKRFFNASKI